jgi:pyridoxal phosphate enzyme (YggS family)
VTDASPRRAELADNLAAVRARISEACAAVGRSSDEITLVAVTKFFPASDAALLVELGLRDLGENRDQEASAKVAEVAALAAERGFPVPHWHFIGQLQTNKARSVARYADLVHSVDRPDLVVALAKGVERAGRDHLDVLLQVSLDNDPTRGGTTVADVLALAVCAVEQPLLKLKGLMAVPPVEADPDAAFARLADLAGQLRQEHPAATIVSAGMSHDLESAIRHGATHVRIGTALLGRRTNFLG